MEKKSDFSLEFPVKWDFLSADASKVERISKDHHISSQLAHILVNRKITSSEDIEFYLHGSLKDLPNPNLLQDMDKAVSRIFEAIQNQEKIFIYGDYDVDGTISTSLFVHFFREINYPVYYYIPHRIHEGYSLNNKALDRLQSDECRLIITVDNGISAVSEIEYANNLGMDVIITDHHQVPENIPNAFAIVNPQRQDCHYPDKRICGAGVVFNLLMALRKFLREEKYFENLVEPDLRYYLDLVALATVADVMPIVGVNRILVKYGLRQMKKSKWVGLRALLEVSQVFDEVTTYDLGFKLGPRINAAGRLYEANQGVQLLISQDKLEAQTLSLKLNQANTERRDIEATILERVLHKIGKYDSNKASYVLEDDDWHLGVLGIVASRLVEKLRRPVFLLCKNGDVFKGSGRSLGAINLVKILDQCSDLLIGYGGHKAAAGLTIDGKNIEKFKERFERCVSQELDQESCLPKIKIDQILDEKEINDDFLNEIDSLSPFGWGNPEPIFCLQNMKSDDVKVLKEKHLKCKFKTLSSDIDVMGFQMHEKKGLLNQDVDLVFHCKKQNFRGKDSISLILKDFKSSIRS